MLVELSVSIMVTDSVSSLRRTCARLDFGDPATAWLIVLLPGGAGGPCGHSESLLVSGSSPLVFCKVGSRTHSKY